MLSGPQRGALAGLPLCLARQGGRDAAGAAVGTALHAAVCSAGRRGRCPPAPAPLPQDLTQSAPVGPPHLEGTGACLSPSDVGARNLHPLFTARGARLAPPGKGPTLEVCGLCCSGPCTASRCLHAPLPWGSPGPIHLCSRPSRGPPREATPLKSRSLQRTGHHCSRASPLPPTWGNLRGHEPAPLEGAIPGPGPIGPKVLYSLLIAPRTGAGPRGTARRPSSPAIWHPGRGQAGMARPCPLEPQPSQRSSLGLREAPKGLPASCVVFSRLFRCEKG